MALGRYVDWTLGRLREAQEHYERSLALSREIGYRRVEAGMHLALGSLRAAAGDEESGRESLVAARDLAKELGFPNYETLARCELALLPCGDAEDALAAYTEHEECLSAGERQAARFLLWRATGDRAHLEEAKRLLDEQMTNYDDETRQRVVKVLSGPREIMAAWRGESADGTPDDPDDDKPRGTESITRIG